MNRFWAILFALVPILGVASFLAAANGWWPLENSWLPENNSEQGRTIDHLYDLIHWVAAVILVLTGVLIAWAMWFGTSRKSSQHIHSHTGLEMLWSIIPGLILVFLSLYQFQSWTDNKIQRPTISSGTDGVPAPSVARVHARQFGWDIEYPGPDGILDTVDDVRIPNELVVPADQTVVLQLQSRDVIHSFFVPQLRLKQDIVPGMKQFVWFRPLHTEQYEIVCAELCGWGHYKMKGVLRIVSAEEYRNWQIEHGMIKPEIK
jgi:cytochrome c oxidase subunit II